MNRLASNDDDKKVRDWFVEETRLYGCFHKIDHMGNIFAIRPGQNNDLPPIAIGSHLDTQPTGGRYDGILGVLCGIEVLRILHENQVTTYAPFAIVNWTNEEGARFPPAMLASGVWAEEFTTDYGQSRSDHSGITLGEELSRIGYLGPEPCSYKSIPLLAHFECHIEQGTLLEEANLPVGAVKGVQCIGWYNIHVTGKESHCGSAPMNRRHDALLAAANIIVAVNKLAAEGEYFEKGSRATIAVINSEPQSINTIAGKVQMSLDVRCVTDEDLKGLETLISNSIDGVAERHGVDVEFKNIWTSPGIDFDNLMVQCVQDSAASIDCHKTLVSSVGHDSVYTSKRVPTAMLFTRCRDGVSHNPAEYTTPEDCAASAEVMLGAYLRYDDLVRDSHGA
ncbi:putative n-carbamoyl-l-amino acid [Phaeomoniella chlamydospora]|uniref:Putative n-carbamoyl-l-amino acid n=1 Tax=Phaeomoniella chlamydospora TaxID=158046 RepID=A0A0G2FYP7_PHACM|nr:putative n-carbamoyl-l-amino acid [Phaeomoniella chlamydospora]